jgi:SAM-dependent methyltransferase
MIKSIVKNCPVVGPLLMRLRHGAETSPAAPPLPATIARIAIDPQSPPADQEWIRIRNILNYTKRSGSVYAAEEYPAGYHSVVIGDARLPGQRDPSFRLDKVPVSFHGKTVLDIGCNQGGMLFAIADRIKWGVGIDYDARMVNAATRISVAKQMSHLRFYVMNVEQEPLERIEDILPEGQVDMVFLLAVCMWIKNWREVIAYAASLAPAMVFESNGTAQQQSEQEEELRRIYRRVEQLTEASTDDIKQRARKLFYCSQESNVK